ncbi:MAG: ComEC/Rec2 family competence protein, partial [Bacteroidota bacterium]
MYWIPFPFIRYVLVLILGIIIYRTLSEQLLIEVVWFAFTVLGLGYISVFFYRRTQKSISHSRLLSTVGLAALVPFGYLLALQYDDRADKTNISNFDNINITAYCGEITSEVYFKGKTWRADLQVESIQTGKSWKPAQGIIRLFLQADSSREKSTTYQDKVLIVSAPQAVAPPSNPQSFDYRAHLANKNIFHTHYLTAQKYRITQKGKPSVFDPLYWGITIRSYGKKLLEEHFTDDKSLAIASALLLGVKDRIDDDLRNAYAGAGAMHILAVSGLHVGIVYTFLSYLFQFFRLKDRKVLTTTIAVLILWLYALITGFSPSVVRAVLMFSFIEIAKLFRRQNITYNSIGASAFLLLLYNPNYVFEVGFQLSYLAVIGIVFLYPRWSMLWKSDIWIVQRAWELGVVSVAAQLATFPLAIYYFHQFPNYFLLTNLIVLPAVAIILQAGLAFLLLGWIPYVGVFFGKLFQWSLWLMNYTVL